MSLAIIETHPVQYHAPVYRILQRKFGITTAAIYASDFSVVGYRDREFNADFSWDTDLLSGYRSLFLSRLRKGLGEVLNNVRPKVVMLVGYSPRFYQMAFYETQKAGYPIIFRGETTDHARRRNILKTYLRDSTLKWIYKRCAKLLYTGQRSLEHFRRLGIPENKLIFSPYCVDTTPFQYDDQAYIKLRLATRQKLNIKRDDIVLLFSGKLCPRKGPDLLLKAVVNLPPQLSNRIVVIFLGEGRLRKGLENFAQTKLKATVHFVGFKNQSELSHYYNAADLLVLPSRHSETWGLVVNEALHHGLPCVVSDAVGCMPDLIEPHLTGEIFKANLLPDLTEALKRAMKLIDNPEIRKKCREKVNGYTIEAAAEGIKKAYEAVIRDER